MSRIAVVACIFFMACTTPEDSKTVPVLTSDTQRRDNLPPPERTADSIALERTDCRGCGGYRLRIARSGDVSLTTLDSGAARRALTSRISTDDFANLLSYVMMAQFLSLPDSIDRNAQFCPSEGRHFDYVTVSLFLPDRVKSVHDYLGCMWGPQALRVLQERIDSVGGARRLHASVPGKRS